MLGRREARLVFDLRLLPDDTEQRVKQHVVWFTHQGQKIRLSLNPWTHLPTMLEIGPRIGNHAVAAILGQESVADALKSAEQEINDIISNG